MLITKTNLTRVIVLGSFIISTLVACTNGDTKTESSGEETPKTEMAPAKDTGNAPLDTTATKRPIEPGSLTDTTAK